MVFKNFKEVLEKCKANSIKKNVALVCAEDEHALEAMMMACADGIVTPVLIGNKEIIEKNLQKYPEHAAECRIIATNSTEESVKAMVELVQKDEVDAVMKGLLQTPELMRAVVSKENGLRTGRQMSHLAFKELPNYHKIICFTDVALNMYPDLETKKQMILNAVDIMKMIGYDEPKVAVLCAVDEVNPKMPETVDAAELKRLNQIGEIPGCIVEGPISYDLALYQEAVDIKKYKSPVAADADILIMPNIHAGNIFVKTLEFTADTRGGGFIVGAKVPIVLTSRSSPTLEKYYGLVMSSIIERR
ncbi:MAG: bifunctional enoyl-CoA hydratase/phosphate acetyltransferase [Clostridiales bacterium]|nr:bifunctional enoyl-CoA hydratase/phosphate acetyltransferase [Clostridiales bacterium]